jgi:hypothetical protein
MTIPSPIYLYRIIHIENLPFIIRRNEITCSSHKGADPNYIGIGDDSLIAHRKTLSIPLRPGGTFNDYIAFYFGKRSPMLYNIKNGYQGVTRRSQDEIIYIVTSFDKVKEFRVPYVYFDGHGYHHLSQVFNNEEGLAYIDWQTVGASKWFDSEDDPDRKRRKQAEFLIYQSLPFQAIFAIATYSDRTKIVVEKMTRDVNKELKIIVKEQWYY